MDKRLIYRVVLKLLFLLSFLVLTLVFINSLFTRSNSNNSQKMSRVIVELDISGMTNGEIRKVQWKGKEVNALHRENKKLFIYINAGDSGNCPLFKGKNGFKDICTGTHFNFSGRQKGSEEHGFRLLTPPNYRDKSTLFVGDWSQ